MRFRIASVISAVLVSAVAVPAADWPQWRGPNRDGASAEKGLLKAWPKEGPKLAWKVEDAAAVGTGYGSPAVVGDKVYLIGGDGPKKDAKELCTCLSAKDGSKVWQTKLTTSGGDFLDMWGGGPRATPTVAGDHLYVLGAMGDVSCLTTADGKVVWTKNLKKDLGGTTPAKGPWWGHSESPLVDGDNVIVTPGGAGGVTALDKKTGNVAWVCKELTDDPGYSSAVVADVGGVRQYVQQTAKSAVGVRATDGKLLWQVGEIKRATAVIPTPVVADGYAFFTASYGAGCEAFTLTKDGDGTKATKVYSDNHVLANHHGGVVRVGDYLYGHSDARGGVNAWVCFEYKKGSDAPVWKAPGVGKGSVTLADGMLYCFAEKDGTLALVKATPDKYEEVSRFAIPSKSKLRTGTQGAVWAHPVVANGKLYLRDFEKLFVFDVAAE